VNQYDGCKFLGGCVPRSEHEELLKRFAALRQENEALWQMVDDFNEAVKKAAARLP
jgi:hypothetical protein